MLPPISSFLSWASAIGASPSKEKASQVIPRFIKSSYALPTKCWREDAAAHGVALLDLGAMDLGRMDRRPEPQGARQCHVMMTRTRDSARIPGRARGGGWRHFTPWRGRRAPDAPPETASARARP